jgi:D-threo-aldose 1-dehydrogenase
MHFAAAHPAVTSLVLGSVSKDEAADNHKTWTAEIPAALWQDLRAAHLIEPGAPLP